MLRLEKKKQIEARSAVLNLNEEEIEELSELSDEELYRTNVLVRPQPGSLNTTATLPLSHLDALNLLDEGVENSETSTHRFLLAHKSLTIQELLNKYGESYSDEVVRAEALYSEEVVRANALYAANVVDSNIESKFITNARNFAYHTRAQKRAPGDRVDRVDRVDSMNMVTLQPRINDTGANGVHGASVRS